MCDYSLELYHSVPATAGETLQVTRFSTGSIGFAAPGCSDVATCVPEGTILRAEIPNPEFGLAIEDVIMARVHADLSHSHHDAVRLESGEHLSLQYLRVGSRVRILMLANAQAREDKGMASEASVNQEDYAYVE